MAITPAPDTIEQILPALRRERDRFVALSFCWADALLELDPAGRIDYAAGACPGLLGVPAGRLVGAWFRDRVAPADHDLFGSLLAGAARDGRVTHPALRVLGDSGERAVAFTGFRLEDLNGHFFIALRSHPIADDKAEPERSGSDAASGLYTAGSFVSMVTRHLAEHRCGPQQNLSLIYLPGYSALCERLAEAAERELAAAVGACVRGGASDGRTAGRLGPDRYGLVHGADLDLGALGRRIADETARRDPEATGSEVQTTTIEIDSQSASEAEIASGFVYTINRFRNFKGSEFTLKSLSTSISALAREAIEAVNSFKQVTTSSNFQVYFQPIVDSRSGAIHHYEALARFPSICGMESPYEHITFAEETGLIADFDVAMAAKVIDWLATATPINGTTRVAVNISGQSINSLAYLAQLDGLLRDNAWARGRLMFEITESAHLGNLTAANAFIQRLRRQGFPVCLDDFGAGAANFEYLSSLEVDVVKLDGASVRSAQKANKGRAFLKALVSLCTDLGVSTVAEMIEDEAALKFVRDCGVPYVQGYLFGQPAGNINVFRRTIPASLFPARRSATMPAAAKRRAAGSRPSGFPY